MISPAVKFRTNHNFPVEQKVQSRAQPTREETQSTFLSLKPLSEGIKTLSIAEPSLNEKELYCSITSFLKLEIIN